MTVFKAYIKIMRNNSLAIFMYMAIFIIIAVISTKGNSSDFGDNTINSSIKVSVINEDSGSSISQGLEKYLNSVFTPVKSKSDIYSIKENLFFQYTDYVLKIQSGGKLEYYVNSDKGYVQIVNQQIGEYLSTYKLMDKYNVEGVAKRTAEIMKNKIPLKYSYDESKKQRAINSSIYMYFNTLSFVILAIFMLGAYIGQSRFNRGKIRDRINISSYDAKSFNTRIFISSFTFFVVIWAIFMLLAVILFGSENMTGTAGNRFIISSIVYLLPASTFAYLCAVVSKSTQMNGALTNIVTLVFAFISGVFIPSKYLPDFMNKLAIVSPMYWNNKIYTSIIEGDFATNKTAVYIGIQILIAITMIAIAFTISKNKTRKNVY